MSDKHQKYGHYQRYPEEELIDVLTAESQKARPAGAELADLFRAVTGKAGAE